MDLLYARLYERLASCPATVCSAAGPRGKQAKPILCRLSSPPLLFLPSLASLSALLPTPPTHTTYLPCQCLVYHPLNSALPGFPATHTSRCLPFIRHPAWSSSIPTRVVSPALTLYSLVDHTALDEQQQQQQDGQPSRFPTSEDRLGLAARFPPELHPARYDPLGSLAQDEPAIARKALCSSFNPRFFPSHVARGILSDGTWTTAHPSVHAFLQSPSSRPSLTSKTSAAIYSLAALHVFYSPSHPAYDVFWHPDIKQSTAMFVHQVVSTSHLFLSLLEPF
jgi:hypothetical protein